MAEYEYLNFELRIRRLTRGRYRAIVLNSPAGQAEHEFRNPFNRWELANFYLRIGRSRQGLRRIDSPEMQIAKDFGKRLFDSVFGPEVYACYYSSLNNARAEGKGLRLRFRFEATELSVLPWEYLYDPKVDMFLSLSEDTPIVRYIEIGRPPPALEVQPPLKLLVMISSPLDAPPLNVEREWAQLKRELSELESRRVISIERLNGGSLIELQRRLHRGDVHILHFIGHGRYDEATQDGQLLFEDEDKRGNRLSGDHLGTILHNHKPLRLVVLNACEGARTSPDDPFSGVAQSLVQKGIPAVIAMQFEVTDRAAITFAREFYGALAAGHPVDAALVEARTAIYALPNDIEWGTAVYFTRAPDGRLFDITEQPITDRPVSGEGPSTSGKPPNPPPTPPNDLVTRIRNILRRIGAWKLATVTIAVVLLMYLLKSGVSIPPIPAFTPTFTPSQILPRTTVPPSPVPPSPIASPTPIPPTPTIPRATSLPTELIAFNSNRSGNYEIYVMNPDGSAVKRITFFESDSRVPAWSPDREWIAFQSNFDGDFEIMLVSLLNEGLFRQITDNNCNDYAPAWSPDGRKIAFYSDCDGNREIYTVNVDGTGRKQLTETINVYNWFPNWSPDGNLITFSSNRSGKYKIYVMNRDGGEVVSLANGCRSNFSPNGDLILFTTYCTDLGNIMVMDPRGTKIDVIDDNGNSTNPSWSPDGRWIVFQSDRSGNEDIWIMSADGSHLKQLTFDTARDAAPDW